MLIPRSALPFHPTGTDLRIQTRMSSSSGRIRAGALVLITVSTGLIGCSNKLETGYEPVKLNATPAQRRAFYALPFSPEAAAAPDREEELNLRRPRPGY